MTRVVKADDIVHLIINLLSFMEDDDEARNSTAAIARKGAEITIQHSELAIAKMRQEHEDYQEYMELRARAVLAAEKSAAALERIANQLNGGTDD